MRELSKVQADISEVIERHTKLIAERDHILSQLAKRESAAHVLENLGWTFSGGKWNKPVNEVDVKPFSQTPLVAGGFATWNNKVLGGPVYMRSVGAFISRVSRVSNVTLKGANVSEQSFEVATSSLTPRDRTYFIGK